MRGKDGKIKEFTNPMIAEVSIPLEFILGFFIRA